MCPLRAGLGKLNYQVNQKWSVVDTHCIHKGSRRKVGNPTELLYTMPDKFIQEPFDASYEDKPSGNRQNPERVRTVFPQLETSEICLLGQLLCFCCHFNYSSSILCSVSWIMFILHLFIVPLWGEALSFHTGICEVLVHVGLTFP